MNEEQLQQKLDKLIIVKNKKEKELALLKSQDNYFSNKESYEITKLKEELYDLYKQINRIILDLKSLDLEHMNPILANNLIALYKQGKSSTSIKGNYYIYLLNSKKIIGEIGCNQENNNIHYVIDEDYQNKGYAYQALLLFVNYLSLNNIENITIMVSEENTYSLRLAQKLQEKYSSVDIKHQDGCFIYCFSIKNVLSRK